MKKLLTLIILLTAAFGKPKALHLTFHQGCAGEITELADKLGFEVDTWNVLDKKSKRLHPNIEGFELYTMTHNYAKTIFTRHKETFESYDLIITSDIAPLSRIFLQNNWKKPLLIWVCNRFDMNAWQRNSKGFPDQEYLDLFASAKDLDNVEIVGYTNYEKYHAEKNRGIASIQKIIPPTGLNGTSSDHRPIPINIDKKNLFFVRNYINERLSDLMTTLHEHQIENYFGAYAGSDDLADFKGMIHIPCVMGNFHLWENLRHGLIHFIPSKEFFTKLYIHGEIEFWDWTSPYSRNNHIPLEEVFAFCDWYNPKVAPNIVYFDSFLHLQQLIDTIDYESMRAQIKNWHKGHVEYCLNEWKPIFRKLFSNVEYDCK